MQKFLEQNNIHGALKFVPFFPTVVNIEQDLSPKCLRTHKSCVQGISKASKAGTFRRNRKCSYQKNINPKGTID
jgi:hypothetical protein